MADPATAPEAAKFQTNEREPWFKVKVGIIRSDKLAHLPSDTARWGFIKVLAEGKMQRRMGVFVNRGHLADVTGAHSRYIDDWQKAGLVHLGSALCDECRARYGDDLPANAIVIHDFLKEQFDPTNADRQAAYRARHRPPEPKPPGGGPRNGPRNGASTGDRNAGANGAETATVTPDVTPASTRARDESESESESEIHGSSESSVLLLNEHRSPSRSSVGRAMTRVGDVVPAALRAAAAAAGGD